MTHYIRKLLYSVKFTVLASVLCSLVNIAHAYSVVPGVHDTDKNNTVFNPFFYYSLMAAHSRDCIDLAYGSLEDTAPFHMWDCNGGDNQLYKAEYVGDGYYRFRNKRSSSCLDIAGRGGLFARVQQYRCIEETEHTKPYNQHFKLQQFNGGYRLKPRHTEAQNLCVDVAGYSSDNGATLSLYHCLDNQLNQIFIPKHRAPREISIRTSNNRGYLSVPQTGVLSYAPWDNAWERFEVVYISHNHVQLKSHRDRYLVRGNPVRDLSQTSGSYWRVYSRADGTVSLESSGQIMSSSNPFYVISSSSYQKSDQTSFKIKFWD